VRVALHSNDGQLVHAVVRATCIPGAVQQGSTVARPVWATSRTWAFVVFLTFLNARPQAPVFGN